MAAVVAQHADQPVVEATDLQHGHAGLPVVQALAGEVLEEGLELLRLGGHLPGLYHVAALVAE